MIGREKDGSEYYYEGDHVIIKRPDGSVGRLHKKHLPDPYKLWESRCKQYGLDIHSREGKNLKPTQITFRLWEAANA